MNDDSSGSTPKYKLCTPENLQKLLENDTEAWAVFEGELQAFLSSHVKSFRESVGEHGVDRAFDAEGEVQNVFLKLLEDDRRFLEQIATLAPGACRKYLLAMFRNFSTTRYRTGKKLPTKGMAENFDLEDTGAQDQAGPAAGSRLMEMRMELIREHVPRENGGVGYLACALLYERLLLAQQHFRLDAKREVPGRRLIQIIERFVPFEEGDEGLTFGKRAVVHLGEAWDACAGPIEEERLPSNRMVAGLLGVTDGAWYQWTCRARKFVIDGLAEDAESLALFRNWPGFEEWGKP